MKELEPPQEAVVSEVPEIVKSGLQGSWLANFFKKPEPIIVRSQDPEVIEYQDRFQADLDAQKHKSEAMEAYLFELKQKQEAFEKKMQEQHQELIRRQEEFEKRMQKQYEDTKADQAEIKSGIATLVEMMKKQN